MDLLKEHFELATGTPDGINRLRELILNLAMQGRLVNQDFSVQSGQELLNEIKKEKAESFREKKNRKNSNLSEVKNSDYPFEIPKNWTLCRIKDISFDWGQKTPDKTFVYIDVGSIDNKYGKVSSDFQILQPIDAPSRARKIVKKGTVIYSTVRPYLLNIAIITAEYKYEAIASTAFAIMHPYTVIESKFIYYYLKSSIFTKYVEEHMKGVAYPAISDKDFFSGYFPLPPKEEQKRIVDKIDELMRLCDLLEKQRDSKIDLLSKINSSVINKLIKAEDEYSLAEAWQFIQNQFELIFSDKKNVFDLKEVILNLAMRGKLSTSDINDISASTLITTIEQERKSLIKQKIISKQKELPEIGDTEKKYNLPLGWEWVRLNEYGIWKSGSTPSRTNQSFYGGDIHWVKSGEVKQGRIKETSETITELAIEKCSLHRNPIGSVLIAMYGANIGEVGVLEIEAATNQAVCACKTYSSIYNEFLYYLLLSLRVNFISQGAGAAQPNISRDKIINTVVPLPPFDEQKRIVEKIKKLFQLADLFESKIEESSNKEVQILNSVLANI